jgi:hypothetical protein
MSKRASLVLAVLLTLVLSSALLSFAAVARQSGGDGPAVSVEASVTLTTAGSTADGDFDEDDEAALDDPDDPFNLDVGGVDEDD